jgi:hypothetical protein
MVDEGRSPQPRVGLDGERLGQGVTVPFAVGMLIAAAARGDDEIIPGINR